MSHLVAGTPRLDGTQKEKFRSIMRGYETFCGLHVMTYNVLGSHFHVLLEVPERQDVSEEEVICRMRAIYSPAQVRERLAQWGLWRRMNNEKRVQQDLDSMRRRMYDLSEYMKLVKQCFSQWYNRTTGRRGTLWEDRFKSIVVEGNDHALSTIAAYIVRLAPITGHSVATVPV